MITRLRSIGAGLRGHLALAVAIAAWSPAVPAVADIPVEAADLDFFESRVRPLLLAHCGGCHTADGGDPAGGLSFDSRADFATARGIAVAGRPDESLLVRAVRYDGELRMPPDGRLPAAAVATLEEWVRRGLPWPDDGRQASVAAFDLAARRAAHWCWHPPTASPPPAVRDTGWCRGDIDRFVLARLEAAGLAPAAEAAPGVLVRRASAILTGLPPAVADVERVATSADPRAFEAYVDELLASPHYGERFARHWLDVARYAETRGHEFDYPIPNAWQYRDWVVRAFNADLPYDRFVREQVAGDLVDLPRLDADGRDESVVGTGFWLLGEEIHAPVDIRQDEAERIDNRVDTFGKAFLGLALGCARCHDHKFDAISAADYYAIAGTVMSSSYRQVPFESLAHNRQVAGRLAAHDAECRRVVLPLVVAACDLPADPPSDPPSGGGAADAVTAAVPAGLTFIADYGGVFVPGGTPLVTDGAAWEIVPVGQPRLSVAADGRPAVRLERIAHARSDPVWATTRSLGERDTPPLGAVDRAGRVLRTPKVRLTEGVLWHRVRGHLQIFTVVDGHVVLQGGPLHGRHVLTIDTQGEWQWIRQDLRTDTDWSGGHVVHVEYAAVDDPAAPAAGVATVVAAAGEPAWPAGAADPAPASGGVFTDTVGRLDARLAAADFDWAGPAAVRLVAEATRLLAARAAITADVRLASATAPALLDGNGIDAPVYLKGSAARPAGVVPRRFLEAIDGPGAAAFPAATSGRRELADRLLAPDNPLTARVLVNRLWHHCFGRGLVPTTDNFGVLGETVVDPTARALLDTLAVRFRTEGWSVKRLVREIVTSSTWRMSSVADPRAVAVDPLNTLHHHHPVRRLEAEAIRDTLLAVSGRLDRAVGGPSVEVFLTEFDEGRGRPRPGPLDGDGRRSLYVKVRRNFLPGFLVAFDMPVPFQALGRRNVTNVPAQALALMNDPFVAEQAAVWARRTLADPLASPADRIERMYREAFARRPDGVETAAALDFLAAQAARHGGDFASDPRHPAAWADLAHVLVTTKEFIFIP